MCHGPVGLLPARKSDGSPLVKGVKLTAFSDKVQRGNYCYPHTFTLSYFPQEEKSFGTDKVVPFLLETRLRELGALYEAPSKPMAEKVGALEG